jgi:DNA-binding response OmpR family regulator
MNVLIVDPYPDAAQTTCELVRLIGHNCRAATSGEDAIAQAAIFDLEVVLLEIKLPGISGYDLAHALRAKFSGSLYLVAFTAMTDDRSYVRHAGFDQHLCKPADARALSRVFERARHAQRDRVAPKRAAAN